METLEHTNIFKTCPRSLINLQEIVSKEQPIEIVSKPTKRFLKKMELSYLYCPDCESQSIYRNGKSNIGTQRFMCKECHLQFVAQYDAVFPLSKRRSIFEQEFDENLKPTGLDKIGTGRKKYWSGAKLETLQMLESQWIKIHANKMIKSSSIRGDRGYKVLLEILVHEAYNKVVS